MITIAHRLKTIISYDRILVLEKGYLKEFDTPFKLLTSPESNQSMLHLIDSVDEFVFFVIFYIVGYFKSLVNENGAAFFEEMRILALKKEEERI